MPESLKELADERRGLYEANKKLLAAAEAESRDLTSEEQAEWDRRDNEIDALQSRIQGITNAENRKQRLSALEDEMKAVLPRQTSAKTPARNDKPMNLAFDAGKWGTIHVDGNSPNRDLAQPEYREAFLSYLSGNLNGNYQSLGLKVSDDTKGGYLVPTEFAAGLIKFLDDEVLMRRLCRVMPPTMAKSVGHLSYDTDIANATWGAEVPASDISEDDTARFGNREMTPHLMTTLIKASQQLLASTTAIGVESFIQSRAAYKFGITENVAFLTGSGAQRPLGIFTASNDGVSTARDTTCASTTTFTMDELINVQSSVKSRYKDRGVWLVHRDFVKTLRKLKYGTGEYMLGIGGEPDTLLSRPIYQDENAPNTFTTGQYIAAFFDPQFYVIQDGMNLSATRLNELFQLKNQVGWVFRKSTDGMPLLAEAFARLKLA